MAKIIIYTVGCPKCKQLEKKLTNKGLKFEICTNVEEMQKLGIRSAPYLSVDDELLDFGKAWKWVSGQGTNGIAAFSSCIVEKL